MGSIALHCYEAPLMRELATITQPQWGNMNDQVINMHLSNFAVAIRKSLTGRRPSTTDIKDKR